MNYNVFRHLDSQATEEENRIDFLINNTLPLNEKMLNLRDSYALIKLIPNGINELLGKLIVKLGGEVYFPRVGDNNERFDAMFSFLPKYECIVEIEVPSTTILDAPRNSLDNYAVIKSRKDKNTHLLFPVVICWDLPNKRTDYWNVVSDVKKIVNLEIKTLSILALAAHHWTKTPLDFCHDYYLNSENMVMTKIIQILKRNDLDVDEFSGYFSPLK